MLLYCPFFNLYFKEMRKCLPSLYAKEVSFTFLKHILSEVWKEVVEYSNFFC